MDFIMRSNLQLGSSFIFQSTFLIILMADRLNSYYSSAFITEQDRGNLDDFIDTVMKCNDIPGLALSIVQSDMILLEKGYGFADVENNVKVEPSTLFPIASTTKAFTSTAVAIAIDKEHNRLKWDSKLSEILGPEFELFTEELTKYVTLRDILSHQTGIPDFFVPLMSVIPENVTRKELIRRLRYHKPIDGLRTAFHYNNNMYLLAGYVLEVIHKKTWEDVIKQEILEPLGMTLSSFTSNQTARQAVAAPYVLFQGQRLKVSRELLRQANRAGPAGAIISNLHDMAKWMQFHLNSGKTKDGEQLISEKILRQTYESQVPSRPPMNTRDMYRPTFPISEIHVSYDLGWMTNIYRGHRRYWHSGSVTPYKVQLWIYPDAGFAIFLAGNGPGTGENTWALHHILHYISDVMLGLSPWQNSSTVCEFPEPWKERRPKASQPVSKPRSDPLPLPGQEYAGVYRSPGFDPIYIKFDQSSGKLHLNMGELLEASLLYNQTLGIFYTNLSGIYQYMPEKIPITFFKSQNSIENNFKVDMLSMPMYSPWSSAEPINFYKGSGTAWYRQYHEEDKKGSHCTSSSSNLSLTSFHFRMLIVVQLFLSGFTLTILHENVFFM